MIRSQLEDFIKQELARARLPAGLYAAHRPHPDVSDERALSVLHGEPVPAVLSRPVHAERAAALRPAVSGEAERRTSSSACSRTRSSSNADGLVPDLVPRLWPREDRRRARCTRSRRWYDEQEAYLLKPMNCPHHIQIYQAERRSYRELPLRLAEFGSVYRFEKTGQLNGMTRVRGFTQDDAHLFCTDEQVPAEFGGCIEMTQFVLEHAGPRKLPRAARLPRSGQRQVRRRRRTSGSGPRTRCEDVCTRLEHRLHGGAGRSGVLRPEGRLRRDRLHRPRVAARHRAARLQPAGAVRAGIRRRRQPHAPAGDDPPRPARLDGAVHRRPDRAFRRRVPAVARAGAGPRDHRQRKERRIRPPGRAASSAPPACASKATTAPKSSAPKSATASSS